MHKPNETDTRDNDGLPGYIKYYIYFNGNLVGYKLERVGFAENPQISWRQRMALDDKFNLIRGMKRVLKWNW